MRRLLALAVLLALVPVMPASAQAPATLAITELLPAPGTGAREFIELRNDGNATVDIAGWSVRDAANNTFTFDTWTLPPGGHVVVWGGGPSDALGPAWTKSTVWNNAGDEARLIDPSGTVVATFAYGSHAGAVAPAPPTNQSVQLLSGAWQAGAPTPGYTPETVGGDATVEVENVAPVLGLLSAPDRVRRDTAVNITFFVDDANGDLASWNVSDASGVLASGASAGEQTVALVAPSAPGPWSLTVAAADAAGQAATLSFVVHVAQQDLEVVLPEGGEVRFPTLRPGDGSVAADDTFLVRNLGAEPVTPYLDVSDFQGPGGAVIPVDGNLEVGLAAPGDVNVTWVDYPGPLTPLPALAPGEEAEVRLRIVAAPVPLPAGTYGTSFTIAE